MKTELVTITPEIAKDLLKKNSNNRNANLKRVNQYALSMIKGDWKTTHQGIAVYEDGSIADGQHRLLAIVQSMIPITILLTTGLSKNDSLAIDQLMPRTAAASIKIANNDDFFTSQAIAVINFLYLSSGSVNSCKIDPFVLVEMATDPVREAISFAINGKGTRKRLTTAPIYAAIACAFRNEKKETLELFKDSYISGIINSEKENAVIRLREFMLQNNTNSSYSAKFNAFLRAQRAIRAFCSSVPLSKLYCPEKSIYENLLKIDKTT